MSTAYGQESLTGYPVRRRVASLDRNLTSIDSMGHTYRRRRPTGSTVAQATDDLGSIPLSQEESSACFAESTSSMGEQAALGCIPPPLKEDGVDVGGIMEIKMRQEIQNGISFIEERLGGLMRLNQKLRMDLEKETRNGEVLRERATMMETRLRMAEVENDELKQQLDSREKEVMRLGEQATEEWRRRVGLEESLVELKREKNLELTSLKDQLDARNAEIRTLESELKHRKQVTDNKENRSETVELAARVNQLEGTLHRLQREKVKVDEVAARLEKDVEVWKTKHASSCRDLELQMGRFQALKKCYADLQEENQKLAKSTQRVLRDPVGSFCPTSVESIRIIDLPEHTKSGGSLQGQQLGHTGLTPAGGKMTGARDMRIATQSRKKSPESAGSDHSFSLPPVRKISK